MNQLAMNFEPVRARRADPVTSQESASRAREFAAGHAEKIRTALLMGDATIYELAKRTGIDHVATARRLSEMENRLAEPTGETRPGPTGRQCRVWRAI